jgi:hypothetical protein
MDGKFDVFRKLPDGQPLWIQAVDGLHEAKLLSLRLAASSPGEYFIYNPRDGSITSAPDLLSSSAAHTSS